jgi:hypothetical protein
MRVFLFGFMRQLAFLSSTSPSIRSVTLVEPISSNAQNSVVVQLRHWTVTLLLDLNYQLWRLCIVEHGDGAAHLASHFHVLHFLFLFEFVRNLAGLIPECFGFRICSALCTER